MHARIPDEQEHLAALAQHMTRTQADYYRVHEKYLRLMWVAEQKRSKFL